MPDLHGLQIKEAVPMSSPVILITGALTGIGRATALAFANEAARVVISGRHDDEGQKLAIVSYATSALKPNFCAPMLRRL
jgi:NAD(P)-dependent dehydrogenase (short-subunit alcohol dehydrogenase family)